MFKKGAQELTDTALTTGIEDLDGLIGGLRPGDNVIWEADSGAPLDAFVRGLLRGGGRQGRYVTYVSLNRSPQAILRQYLADISPGKFVLLDCFTSGKGREDSVFSEFYRREAEREDGPRVVRVERPSEPDGVSEALELLRSELGKGSLQVFDSITGMLELWASEQKVLEFFTHMCPRLYELNTVAYWILERQAHGEQFLAKLRHTTQVVIELSVAEGRTLLRLRKAEGRRSPRLGMAQSFIIHGEQVRIEPEQREELEVAVLREISETIGGALDLESVFEETMAILARELRMLRGTLVLHDKTSDTLKIVAAHGLSPQEKRRGRYAMGEGITGRVVQTGQSVRVSDVRKDPAFLNRTGARAAEKAAGQVSFVCVPLRVDQEVVGAISIDRHYVDDQTLAKDERLLQIIASLVGQAIKINRMAMREKGELLAENRRPQEDLRSRYKFGNIVAASGAMQDVVAAASAVANSSATVLIRGETGTGKELIAHVLHYNSNRADGPFVKVNCGALPEGLLESELFGHVKGSFTGAVEDRKGRFELADGGTIFLDEVGNMSERLQVKLLRVLQEREFERVGGTETIKVNVRVVAATNMDLEKQMEQGAFREDLFYRLNVIPLFIPPLRERREDIPFLVEHFLEKYNRQYHKDVSRTSREVLDALIEYPWPGNVRELESCIERAVVLSQDGNISLGLLPINVRSFSRRELTPEQAGPAEEVLEHAVRRLSGAAGSSGHLYDRVMSRVEKVLIAHALKANGSVQTRAARQLGISRNTLRRKVRDYGLGE